MKVCPVSNTTNSNMSFKGSVSKDTANLLLDVGDKWVKIIDEKGITNQIIVNTIFDNAHRIMNVLTNLNIIMERFCHACELKAAKSAKTGKYRFFIENKHSNYKLMCGDAELNLTHNKLADIYTLGKFEEKLAKLDPYKENTNFIIQRKASSKGTMYDSEFVPDEDYIFLEDKLVGKEPKKEATMKDIEDFINAAKEEGLIV